MSFFRCCGSLCLHLRVVLIHIPPEFPQSSDRDQRSSLEAFQIVMVAPVGGIRGCLNVVNSLFLVYDRWFSRGVGVSNY